MSTHLYPTRAVSTSVNALYQEQPQTRREIDYRNYRASLIAPHLGNGSPLEISRIVESYLKFAPIVPFPAAWPFISSDKIRFSQQFLAFYHHCKLYSSPSGDKCLKGEKTEILTLDLISKNLVWIEHQNVLCIKNISVETWIESEFTAFEGLAKCVLGHAQKWTFELVFNGHPKVVVYHLENDREIPLNKIPYIFLDGNEFEWHTLASSSRFQVSIKDKTWDNWKQTNGPGIETTRSVIFPLFVEAIRHTCSVFSAPSVLDVGGCDGDLGFFLLDRCQKISSYTIIEKSESLSHLADTRSKCDCPFLSENRKKLKVIHGDFRSLEIFEAMGKKQSDVIILSGVIAQHVLSQSDSLELVENCKRSLKDMGFLLVAAYSQHYFGADEYRSMGFKVLNKSFSFIDYKTPMNIQFYVLQKETLQG